MDDKEGVYGAFPWEKAFQFVTRREVVVSSLVGLCGIGLLWQGRRWLGLSSYERKLLLEHGIMESWVD
jgi:hypothetical protein